MDEREKKRPGVVDRTNALYSKYRQGRFAFGAGRFVLGNLAKRLGTVAVGATSEVWGPVAIAIGVVVLLTIIIIFITKPQTGFTLPEEGTPSSGRGPIPPATDTTSLASCPVAGGTISTPSYQTNANTGHCGTSYTAAGFNCDINSRRAKSIDVVTGGPSGKDVVLPTIRGQTLQWKYVTTLSIDSGDCEEKTPGGDCGRGLVFYADMGGGESWTLHFIHMEATTLQIGDTYPSGTTVGKTGIGHVHISVGKNIQGDPAYVPIGSFDARPGWLAADKELGMCTTGGPIPPPSGKCSPGTGFCSVEHLRPYFGDQAISASIVCNGESGGDPSVLNPNCSTNDYSVGLFQINLVAHCPGTYGPGKEGPQSCDNLLDINKRNVCEARWRDDPIENIKKAVEIFRNSGSWSPWGAAKACGIQ